jgi:hypothetical protein
MKRLKNILAMLLCFAIVLSLFFFAPDMAQTAEAAMSLPGIEQIKHSGSTFNILEIVPQAGSGSIGWYVDGQEPGANWAGTTWRPSPRRNCAEQPAAEYLGSLDTAGLLGGNWFHQQAFAEKQRL